MSTHTPIVHSREGAVSPKTAPGLIANVPEGLEALRLAERLSAGHAPVCLHIARDDARMEQLAECLKFFAPEARVEAFPAWDCLPYDRLSMDLYKFVYHKGSGTVWR